VRLPGWLRVALSNCADGVLQVRQSQDRQTVHVLSYVTSMPDVGDMVTAWEHRTVDLRSGWVDATRYAREPDDDSRKAEMRKFWEWVERQTAAPLLPFGPASVAWQLWDPNQSDTQKAPQSALRDGVRVTRCGVPCTLQLRPVAFLAVDPLTALDARRVGRGVGQPPPHRRLCTLARPETEAVSNLGPRVAVEVIEVCVLGASAAGRVRGQ